MSRIHPMVRSQRNSKNFSIPLSLLHCLTRSPLDPVLALVDHKCLRRAPYPGEPGWSLTTVERVSSAYTCLVDIAGREDSPHRP